MKKTLLLFLIIVLNLLAVPLFAEEDFNKDVLSSVKAVSNSETKKIISKIDGKKLENKIQMNITKKTDGSIEIVSEYFKLGKMPFSSYFYFTIKKEDIKINEKGEYEIKNCKGVYKVLTSKKDAFLTGSFNEKNGNLVLTTKGRGRTLSMEMSY